MQVFLREQYECIFLKVIIDVIICNVIFIGERFLFFRYLGNIVFILIFVLDFEFYSFRLILKVIKVSYKVNVCIFSILNWGQCVICYCEIVLFFFFKKEKKIVVQGLCMKNKVYFLCFFRFLYGRNVNVLLFLSLYVKFNFYLQGRKIIFLFYGI